MGRLDGLLDFVEPLAGGGPVGLVHRGQPFLDDLQSTALGADELYADGLQRGSVASRVEGGRRLAEQGVQFGQEIGKSHEWNVE